MSKRYFLKFDTPPGSPKHSLSRPLVIGSELGDIIFKDDKNISSKHCLFSVSDDVISLVDYGSRSGTFVNGGKLNPGKTYLLKESDGIVIGDIPVRILVEKDDSTQLLQIPKEEVHVPSIEESQKVVEKNEVQTRAYIEDIERQQKEFIEQENKNKRKVEIKLAVDDKVRTGGVWATFRVMAVLMDIFLAFTLHTLLNPYVFYKQLIGDFEQTMNAFLIPYIEKSSFIEVISHELMPYLKYVMLYMVVRVLGSLVFAVSPGEYLMGMRSFVPFILGRLISIPRNVLGFLLAPFILFDLPCLFHQRTFKEVLTFSIIEIKSKTLVTLGIIFFFPFVLILSFASPLFQGFEAREKVAVTKFEAPENKAKEALSQKSRTQFYEFDVVFDESLYVYPYYELVQIKKKKRITPFINLYDREHESKATFSLYKKFSFRKLLIMATEMDPLFKFHFPVIHSFIHDISSVSKNFRNKRWSDATKQRLKDEIKKLTKQTFSLESKSVIDYMKMRGPFIKGAIEYRDAFYYMLQTEKINDIQFLNLGDFECMRLIVDDSSQTLKHYIIPLNPNGGRIFKIEFETRNYVNNFYEKYFYNLTWDIEKDPLLGKDLNEKKKKEFDELSLLDLVMTNRVSEANFTSIAKFIFKTYYARASEIIASNDEKEMDVIKSSLRSHIQIFKVFKRQISNDEKFGEQAILNLADLLESIEKRNKIYFGLEDNPKEEK